VDLRTPVLCAPFFASCEAMEFAETGHRREERPDLPIKFVDCSPRLAARVRQVDGINSFLPSLLLLLL